MFGGKVNENQNSIQEEMKSRLKSGNTCCHSVQNILSSSFLSSSSSSSLGAEPPLIGGFGLLNDILPLCSVLDTD